MKPTTKTALPPQNKHQPRINPRLAEPSPSIWMGTTSRALAFIVFLLSVSALASRGQEIGVTCIFNNGMNGKPRGTTLTINGTPNAPIVIRGAIGEAGAGSPVLTPANA